MNDHHPQRDVALAAWIRAARRQAGMSQVELAARLGLAQSSVSQWEKGVTQPSTRHMLTLLQMFSASVAELIASEATGDAPTAGQSA
jgi:transcriptional regulator with XRE-family HTH domain